MKKRTIAGTALFLTAALLGSCGSAQDAKTDALIDSIVNDAAAQAAITAEKPVSTVASTLLLPAETTAPADVSSGSSDTTEDTAYLNEVINVDLTTMNSTMIYSVIYDIITKPESYYGKRLLLDGYFDTSYDERLGTRYYFVVVPDATACCSQGLEFILNGSAVYPDDYPEPGTDIRINGVLDRYEEEGKSYCYIRTDSLSLL